MMTSERSTSLSDAAPTDRMELDQAASIPTPEGPKEQDPHAAIRMSIAEKYEARRLAEIEAGPQTVYPEPDPEPDPPPEPLLAEPEPPDVRPSEPVRREVERAPVAAPEVPVYQPPQLFPLQLPNGSVVHVTGEQLADLARRGAMAEMQPPAPIPAAAPEPRPATHPANFDGDKAREIVKALAYGNEDDGVRVLQEFAQTLAPPAIDVDGIRQQTKDELRSELRMEQNLNIIGSEFPDVFGNRIRSQAAALQLDDIRRDPNSRYFSELDLYREACSRVRRDLGGAGPQPQPESTFAPTPPVSQAASATPSGRLERKRGAPSMPSASDRRLGAADDAPREPTKRETINQIRVSRGQAPLE